MPFPSDATCKTCQHWQRVPAPPHQAFTKEYLAGGKCTSEKLTENYEEYRPDTLVYSYHEGGDFWTGPDFGCVHHLPIEPQAVTENDEN
jgi:hypothetical protein